MIYDYLAGPASRTVSLNDISVMTQHVSVISVMLEMMVTKQLIVSTSTSALMKLLLVPKMNYVLILLDRTNAILFQVSLSFKTSIKIAKMQKNNKIEHGANCKIFGSYSSLCIAESHYLSCRHLINYSHNQKSTAATYKWRETVTWLGDKGNGDTRYITNNWYEKWRIRCLLNALRT